MRNSTNEQNKITAYVAKVPVSHRKKMGQFFTPPLIAEFMCRYVCKSCGSRILDPAAGNSIFLSTARRILQDSEGTMTSSLVGYELDPVILNHFGNPAQADLRNADYLLSDWEECFDGIICNPPYHRFQKVEQRDLIGSLIGTYTGFTPSSYTNLYILFLLKSIYQLALGGRLAYLIPSEFLNSKYGEPIKKLILERQYLRGIINLRDNKDIFPDATTTCCILLLEKSEESCCEEALFANITSMEELRAVSDLLGVTRKINSTNPEAQKKPNAPKMPEVMDTPEQLKTDMQSQAAGNPTYRMLAPGCILVPYTQLSYKDKWRSLLLQEAPIMSPYDNKNLIPVRLACRISRGIATGANEFFCLTKEDVNKWSLPEEVLSPCVCKSKDVSSLEPEKGAYPIIFDWEQFCLLERAGKPVYLLQIPEQTEVLIEQNEDTNTKNAPITISDTNVGNHIWNYLNHGIALEVHKKYLPASRSPWYAMEKQVPAPIWVSSASRDGIRFVRNLASVKCLTTFHCLYLRESYIQAFLERHPALNAEDLTNLLFCYFLTDSAQQLLRDNRKEMGNGLDKYQPGDLMQATMLDLSVLREEDISKILSLYEELKKASAGSTNGEMNPARNHILAALQEITARYLMQG